MSDLAKAQRAGSGTWTTFAVDEVGDGVYRVPLPLEGDALRAVNVYVLTDGDQVTLIDSGWSFGRGVELLEKALGTIDRDLGAIDRVLVTHFHRDHYTLAIRLRERFGTTVMLGAGEAASLEAVLDGRADGRRSMLTLWGAEPLRSSIDRMPADPESMFDVPDVWLQAPMEVEVGPRTLEVLPTPGHTRGHLVFVDRTAGLLFSGDHVLPQITPSIGVETVPSPLPLGDFMASLQLVRELPDLDVLPAHGPLGSRSHRRIDELLEHHRLRLSQSRDAVGQSMSSAFDVARRLSWTRRERTFAELDPHNQMLAVSETAAHLDVLVRDGGLVARQIEGTKYYESRNQEASNANRHE
jgi:glyoxylase-like metal-dependent hydrolase (beta-lactamase superfamily II)